MSRRFSSLDHNSSRNSSGRRLVRAPSTQLSLQEASAALENAFDHIRHVRRSLLRLTETFPEPLTSHERDDSVNPGHEALVLSGGSEEEREHDNSNRAQVAPGNRGVDDATGTPSTGSPIPNHPRSNLAVDQSPLPGVLPPRLSRQNLPMLSPDSAATSHGMLVAARERANSTASQNENAPRDPRFSALGYELLQLALSPDILHYPPDDIRIPSATLDQVPHVPPSRPSNVYPFGPNMPMSNPPNRLNYLPLPPLPPPGRPIQRPSSNLPGPPRPRPTTVHGGVINENMVLSEDYLTSWSPPSEYAPIFVPRRDPHNRDAIRITRANESTFSPPESQRGWARLDLDGNEIPWDEEEELERSRTEYRLRALHRSQEYSNGPRDDRTFHGSVLDSMLNVPVTIPRTNQWRSPTIDIHPLWVDPLPMPLSSMIMKEHQDDYHPDVIVPRHSYLAGR